MSHISSGGFSREGFKYNEVYMPPAPSKPPAKEVNAAETSAREIQRDTPPQTLQSTLSKTSIDKSSIPETINHKQTSEVNDLREKVTSKADRNSFLYKAGKFMASHTITKFVVRAIFLPVGILIKLNIINVKASDLLHHQFKLGVGDAAYEQGKDRLKIRSSGDEDNSAGLYNL